MCTNVSLPPIEFRIDRTDEEGGAVRLIVRGELDALTAPRLQAALDRLRDDHTPVLLDLSEIGFVDSSGLAVLVAAKRQAQTNGWRFAIDRQLAQPVQRLFQLAGIESFIWR